MVARNDDELDPQFHAEGCHRFVINADGLGVHHAAVIDITTEQHRFYLFPADQVIELL